MKIHIICCLAIQFSTLAFGCNAGQIRGYIKTDATQTDKTPKIKILFSGKETMTNDEGFFSVPLDERVNRYSLLICKNVRQNFVKTNTIRNVCMEPDNDYCYYEFERIGIADDLWRQQEKRLNMQNPVTPENCIIMLMDPACVARLEPWKVSLPAATVKVPMIVLKKEVDNKTLQAESAKSLLLALDEKPFHENIKEEVRAVAENSAKQPVTVSLTQ
jgi:hypothetical protein